MKILEDLVKKRKATAAQLQAAQDKLDDAEDEAKKALQARRQQRRENIQERLDLKIQIAQDNGNVKAEIAAREAQIRNTKKLISQTRKGSLQRLRLIAELRREQRELRDLKKEKEKATDDAKAVVFAFLQAQQGFAANLLSNLVPFHIADNALGDAGARVPGSTASPGSTRTPSVTFPGALLSGGAWTRSPHSRRGPCSRGHGAGRNEAAAGLHEHPGHSSSGTAGADGLAPGWPRKQGFAPTREDPGEALGRIGGR